ncbi:MAG: hypothetical protein Q8900_10215 [Bacillota bacterium]|nr:hypothetical protein [Bacillota bacterium]
MECSNVSSPMMNISNFSKIICKNMNITEDTLRDYLFANISISLIKTTDMKNDINKLYHLDKLKYIDAVNNSTCKNHTIIIQGTLSQEIYARKVLGILLIAEDDFNLRSKVIKLLRKHYPMVFNSVKQHNLKSLKTNYSPMNEFNREIESHLLASVYFYFSIYRSPDLVDQGCISSIITDMQNFEFCNAINADMEIEVSKCKPKIDKIKALIKEKYGKINSITDIFTNKNTLIQDFGFFAQNIFITNKIDINYIFNTSEYINTDKIILAYIQMGQENLNTEFIALSIISGIFIQALINEYKNTRNLYFMNNQEKLLFEAAELKESLQKSEQDNIELKNIQASLKIEKINFDKTLNDKILTINKNHSSEINGLQNKIKELENQLSEEKKYRNELNALREYVFEVNNEYIPDNIDISFESCIKEKKILIIGGSKDWRRKFRDTYPEIRTLHGFNENFELTILNSYNYIFFYTGYINHATYYKAMNFIRTHQVKFGYIGKTNVELVKEEIIEEIQRLNKL